MYRCHCKRALGKKISQNVRILINRGLLVGFSLVLVFYICNVCCDLLLGPEIFQECLATKDILQLIRTESLFSRVVVFSQSITYLWFCLQQCWIVAIQLVLSLDAKKEFLSE